MEWHGRIGRTGAVAAFSGHPYRFRSRALACVRRRGPVGDVLKGLGVGGGPAPAAGVPGGSGYHPPLHGDNPHGQGTAASADFFPSNTLPLGGDTDSSTDGDEGEDIVLGRSRGEQNSDGSYHGKVTILSLFGTDVIPSVETGPNEEESGEFGPIEDLLEAICEGSGGELCIAVLEADSKTTDSGSENSFNFFNLNAGGEEGLHVSALSSNGNIQEDSNCQTAHGDSSVVDVAGQGQPIVTLGDSETDSKACNNAPSSQENDSSFFILLGEEISGGVRVRGTVCVHRLLPALRLRLQRGRQQRGGLARDPDR